MTEGAVSSRIAPTTVPDPRAGATSRRIMAALVAAGAIALLGVAAWLEPAADGHGTHEQLGMPACGWIIAMDLPCPTCGMTTAFAHAANGDVVASVVTQPLGFLLALGTAVALIVALQVLVTGSRLGAEIGRLWGRRAGWIAIWLLVGSWGYKIIVHHFIAGGSA